MTDDLVRRAVDAPGFVVRALAAARDVERLAGLLSSASPEVRVRAAIALAPIAQGPSRAALAGALATIAKDAVDHGAREPPWIAVGAVLARFEKEETRAAADVLARADPWARDGAAAILLEAGLAADVEAALDAALEGRALVLRLARADRAFVERVGPGIVRRLRPGERDAWDAMVTIGPAILAFAGADQAIARALEKRWLYLDDPRMDAIARRSRTVALAMLHAGSYDRAAYLRALLAHLPDPEVTRAFEVMLAHDRDRVFRELERLGPRAEPARAVLRAWAGAQPNRVEAHIAFARVFRDDPEPRELVWTLLRERDVVGAATLARALGRIDRGMRGAFEDELARDGVDEATARAVRNALRV